MFKLLVLTFLFASISFSDSGSWRTPWVDQAWNNDANWTGMSFPNGIGEIAAFINAPTTSIVDSSEDITIGSLHFDIINNSVTVAFTNNKLIFDKSNEQNNQANIFNSSGQTHFMDTLIELRSELAIFVGTSSSIHFQKPITGDHSVSFFVDPSTHINYDSANSYTGLTMIYSGNLDLNGPLNATNIAGDLIVSTNGAVWHGSGTSNNYNPAIPVSLNGGSLTLNGTTQTIGTLNMTKQSVIFGSNVVPSELILTNSTSSLNFSENSFIAIDNISITNGGAISNTFSPGAAGFINGMFAFQGFTSVDLNNNLVPLNLVNNSASGAQRFDHIYFNVHFVNGTLEKTGDGQALFMGDNNQIPELSITSGQVQIGLLGSSANVDGPGTVTVTQGALLNGFGTLGSAGNVTVNNVSGIFFPADLYQLGNFTIAGNYNQSNTGNMLIQGQSASSVSSLTVTDGNVFLDGSLYFSTLPNDTLAAGDELVLIDAVDGQVTGTFAQFHYSLPKGLAATLRYTDNQVIMRIVSCQ